jgi:Uma2 family endonuclease
MSASEMKTLSKREKGMSPATKTRATLDDLYKEEGKAELVNGRIETFMASGDLPTEIAFEIAVSLREYANRVGKGVAKTDGIAYAVPKLTSGRESFSPDASYYVGPRPANRMRFVEGAPTFAVEVRSENDYSAAAEKRMAAKRADYFEAGTLVVWDVDPKAQCIHVYTQTNSNRPETYGRGQIAQAEPAVPGWRLPVDQLFE